jgi:hypothetical protein
VFLHRDLVPAIWPPDPRVRVEHEEARFLLHLVKHRSMRKQASTLRRLRSGARARSATCSASLAVSRSTASAVTLAP